MPTEQRRPADAFVNTLHERPANRAFNKETAEAALEKAVAASHLPLFGLIAQTAFRPHAWPSEQLLPA